MRKPIAVLLSFMLLNAWLHLSLRASASLEVQPDAGRGPFLQRISRARQRVMIVMFRLTDTEIIQALASARKRGLTVRVLLNRDRDNERAFRELTEAGCDVRWGNPAYPATHQKSIILDREAWILTHNLQPVSFQQNRGFGLLITDLAAIAEMEQVMLADWEGKPVKVGNGDLLWAPNNARAGTLALIGRARNQIEIYNEHMSDPEIERALLDAVKRNVKVRLLMTGDDRDRNAPARRRLREGGVEVRMLTRPFVHAKLLLVDQSSGTLGSVNYSPGSLDENRELCAVLKSKKTVAQLRQVFERDWLDGQPL